MVKHCIHEMKLICEYQPKLYITLLAVELKHAAQYAIIL